MARLRAALEPFAKWNEQLLSIGWEEDIPLGLAFLADYPRGACPTIGDLHRAAAAYGPLPKVEP